LMPTESQPPRLLSSGILCELVALDARRPGGTRLLAYCYCDNQLATISIGDLTRRRSSAISNGVPRQREAEMPIRRYMEKGVVFTPQALSAMSRALEATTQILGIESDEPKRQLVARFIIRLAREDDSLDGAALRDRAVAALEGVAYVAPHGILRSSSPRATAESTAKRWILHDGEAGAR